MRGSDFDPNGQRSETIATFTLVPVRAAEDEFSISANMQWCLPSLRQQTGRVISPTPLKAKERGDRREADQCCNQDGEKSSHDLILDALEKKLPKGRKLRCVLPIEDLEDFGGVLCHFPYQKSSLTDRP